jgi:AbrB family looped-hinge helix DNA binding protein
MTVRRTKMDVAARVTSKGQITIPKPVREALNLGEGDQVVFRVIEGGRAILARTPDLLELAGSVPVSAEVRGLPWEEIRRRAWASQIRG